MLYRSLVAERIAETGGRSTGFDFLRIFLAVSVLCWHSVLSSYGVAQDVQGWAGPFRVFPSLVDVTFFALSGFLVAGSLERSRSLAEFSVLRALRLIPALSVQVCLSALILGPIVTIYPLAEYFSQREFHRYWRSILGDIYYTLPGVYVTNPTNIVNISLWTIPFEIYCYIALGLLALFSLARKPKALILLFAAATVVFPLIHVHRNHGWFWGRIDGLVLVLSFTAGVLLFALREKIVLKPAWALFSLISCSILLERPDLGFLAPLPAAYLTVYIGLANPPKNPILMSGDLSYGVYLYAFPIQQLFCWLFPMHRHWWLNIAFALPVTLTFAALSWTFVERPILTRKKTIISLGRRAMRFFWRQGPAAEAAPLLPTAIPPHISEPTLIKKSGR
ncbi:MAG TPA: acyltransferase [Xanthobacteraceae bacterium]|nr:acyltransferase [Xanthobacteraceae bacterium]